MRHEVHGGDYWRRFFWVVAPCFLLEIYRRFRGVCCLQHQGVQGLTVLTMGVASSFEAMVNFYHTAQNKRRNLQKTAIFKENRTTVRNLNISESKVDLSLVDVFQILKKFNVSKSFMVFTPSVGEQEKCMLNLLHS